MGFSRRARAKDLLAALSCGSALWLVVACSRSKQVGVESADNQPGPPPACHENEVREYYCDDLLPFNSDKPAPEPYQTCPQTVGVQGNVFQPTSSWAVFDVPRTEWTRKRVPPGHACCYSYCSKLPLADVDDVDPQACSQPNAMPEHLCFSAAEAGVSDAAAAPNQACTEAIAPPPGVAFSPPKAAALDLSATAQHRSEGLSECCYSWCSKAPLGTGLGAK